MQAKTSSPIKTLWREPLLQFLVLGVLIFVGAEAVNTERNAQANTILVDDAVAARLARLYEKQMGVAPDADQVQALVDTYIHEEILYREALRLGLDNNDEIIRRRLVQKMEFLAGGGMAAPPEPTEDELRRFYETHADAFLRPAKASFTHLYFSPDKGGAAAARARAEEALAALANNAEATEGIHADAFPLQKQYAELAPQGAAQLFGATEIADALFAAPLAEWSGPYASGYGWHLIRVSDRSAEAVPPFAEVREAVAEAFQQEEARRDALSAFEDMQKRYVIIRSADEEDES